MRTSARLTAEAASAELGVPINVINKTGGAHIPATMNVIEKEADGYTTFQWSPPSFMVVPLTRAVPYSARDDFIPLYSFLCRANGIQCVLYTR